MADTGISWWWWQWHSLLHFSTISPPFLRIHLSILQKKKKFHQRNETQKRGTKTNTATNWKQRFIWHLCRGRQKNEHKTNHQLWREIQSRRQKLVHRSIFQVRKKKKYLKLFVMKPFFRSKKKKRSDLWI